MQIMSSETQALFPNLPPELRNEIYAYISTFEPDSVATNLSIPLKLKAFSCKHTMVQVCAVHHGAAGLLALPQDQYAEAREYHSWLLNNALELRIGVHFRGRVNTFIQADWDKKMEAHLRKLVKLYPWLNKVAKYDIQILWDCPDGALKSKNKKRIAGRIPLDMSNTLTQLMDADVKRKRGSVHIGLHLDHRYAVRNALSPIKFGLDEFLSNGSDGIHGFTSLTREVRKARYSGSLPRPPSANRFVIPTVLCEEKEMLEMEDGVPRWSSWTQGQLVMKKIAGSVVEVGGMKVDRDEGVAFPFDHLLAECLGRN